MKDILKQSIDFIHKDLIAFIRINLLFIGFIFFTQYISAIIAMELIYKRVFQEYYLALISLPFSAYIMSGIIYHYVSIKKGVTGTINQIFRGYRWLLPMLFYTTSAFFVYRIFLRVIIDFLEYDLIIQIHILFGIIFAFGFGVRTIFLPILIVDKNLKFVQALKESFQLTRDKFIVTSQHVAFSLGILAIGILALGVGFLYSFAVLMIYYVILYDKYTETLIVEKK